MTAPRSVAAVTCLGCGCACDDIVVTVEGETIVDAAHACALGRAWFSDGEVPWATLHDRTPVSLADAVDEAASLLVSTTGRVLLYVGPDVSCEAQRAAFTLADVLRATVDTATSPPAAAGLLAAQRRGRTTATLGEIRNRADVLVFWGVDPAERYPRYMSRYAPEPSGTHVPGRAGRTVVAVSIGRDGGPADADVAFTLDPAEEVAALTAMRATILGATLASPSPGAARAVELARELTRAKYAAVVYEAEPTEEQRDPLRAEALLALVQALNGPTRAALSALRAGGNRSGAEAALTWQTGYPFAVDFASGAPRYLPRTRGLDGVAAGQYAVVVVVGSAAGLSAEHQTALGQLPVITIGPRASEAPFAPRLAIDTGVAGIHESGTAYRLDEVPLPLRPALSAQRTATAILVDLTQAVIARRRRAS